MEAVKEKARQLRTGSVYDTDDVDMAIRYYAVLCAFNGLKLARRDIQLLGYVASGKNIGNISHKREFCERFGTSFPTMGNIVSKLKKLGILVKENGRIKVADNTLPDFSQDVLLALKFNKFRIEE
jgi:hypothetical protein